MKLSTDRILTTHVGSLPRADQLVEIVRPEYTGNPADQGTLESMISETKTPVLATDNTASYNCGLRWSFDECKTRWCQLFDANKMASMIFFNLL